MNPTCTCPTCGATLALRHEGALDAWTCPLGHGLGFTLTEAYERLPDDEIHTVWALARTATPGSRRCPMCGQPMVTVSVPGVDGAPPVDVDVCVTDELLWFDAGELDRLPPGRPDAPPSADEQHEIDEITQQFGVGLQRDWAAEDEVGLVNRVAARCGHHPVLDHVFGVGARPGV
jgi:Zn-finger nucleic acid-binding protein